MTNATDRRQIVELVNEARMAGAPLCHTSCLIF